MSRRKSQHSAEGGECVVVGAKDLWSALHGDAEDVQQAAAHTVFF